MNGGLIDDFVTPNLFFCERRGLQVQNKTKQIREYKFTLHREQLNV